MVSIDMLILYPVQYSMDFTQDRNFCCFFEILHVVTDCLSNKFKVEKKGIYVFSRVFIVNWFCAKYENKLEFSTCQYIQFSNNNINYLQDNVSQQKTFPPWIIEIALKNKQKFNSGNPQFSSVWELLVMGNCKSQMSVWVEKWNKDKFGYDKNINTWVESQWITYSKRK